MFLFDLVLLIFAAFGAGVLNTLAGGGTFLTFPALVFTGVPVIAANATSAVAVFPGYLGGAIGFRKELREIERSRLVRLTLLALIGAMIGSLLLLVTPNETFSAIVPFLLLFATLTFVYGAQIRAWAASNTKSEGAVGLVAVSLYGGYFNGGLGIVLLALFSLWGWKDIHQMNGLKNWLSFALSGISVGVFATAGLIEWQQVVVMMFGATIGGYIAAPLARKLPHSFIRGLVIAVGFGMSAVFFIRLFFG